VTSEPASQPAEDGEIWVICGNACAGKTTTALAGITAIVSDAVIGEGFESLTQALRGRLVNFVALRPPAAVLRQRGIGRLPEEAAYLADRYGEADHPESATFAARVQAAAHGRPVNEFEGIIKRGPGPPAARRALG
jgi:hypothetical protein